MGWELVIAMLLDAVFGEPRMLWDRLPHPAVLMGRLVAFLDRTFNTGQDRKSKGVLALALLCFTAAVIGSLLSQFGWVIEIIVAAILLAQKSLIDHVKAVATGLRKSIEEGRIAVSMIVSRDTKDMNEAQVARSAIESAAENFSDGVIAPLFWYLILGLPGLLAYKFVNTGDSMVGYKTPKYMDFGWATARFDDVLNWVPARLTALLISLPLIGQRQTTLFAKIKADAALHRSPNAGWPEAALAYTLDIALSGPRWYHGTQQKYPLVNAGGKQRLNPHDIDRVTHMIWKTWGICVCIIFAMALL